MIAAGAFWIVAVAYSMSDMQLTFPMSVMYRIRKSLVAILLCLIAFQSIGQNAFDVDVCVYGGTSAGVIAAYTARKLGKSVLLIEPGRHLGGMTSGGLGYTDIGNKYAITGLARDFYRKVGKHYGKFEQWTFEPHVAEEIFNDYVKRADFQVLFERRLKQVRKEQAKIVQLILESSSQNDAQDIVVTAKMFIDCGYEGDLMAMAGVPYRIGRESNSEFNETINGVQLLDGHQFPDGIDPYKIPGKPRSGLLWGITKDTLKANGEGDKKIQAYNFRICLTGDRNNQVPITRPAGYDSTKYELLLRLFEALPQKRKLNDYFIWSRMPNNKTDINNRGGFSTDMIGMNYNYPEGTYEQRAAIIKDHELYMKGLLYFYGHDPRVPLPLREEIAMWGYPKDEYIDNGNWSPQLYIRESRRMTGAYVMSQANCEGKKKISDGVGLAAYTMDSHNCARLVVNGQVKNEGNVEVGGFGPYPISYRSIIPKSEHAENLLVPVCLSATHIAYGSIRMEPVFMVLAQSAATAAVYAIDGNTSVQQVNVKKLQQELKTNPLADWSERDVLVDNDDKGGVSVSGKWQLQADGGYGKTFLLFDPLERRALASKEEKIQTVRFHSGNRWAGTYDLYMYIPKVENAAEYTRVIVSDGIKSKERVIRTAGLKIEGQTSGEWVSLGQQTIERGKRAWVEITSAGATGRIVADAVIWVPVRKQLTTADQ
jgi:hypothetical protein